MTFPEPHYVDTNGIKMAVYELGPKDGVPVVMCHGFPEIAYSWSGTASSPFGPPVLP